MALTRKTQATVAPTELARLREHLAPYGSSLLDNEGEAILVLRVPGNEPDLVNDMEEAAEYIGPELQDAKALLLLGNTGSTVVPPEILQPIVQMRRKRDQEFAKAIRPAMKGHSHRIMAAPGDAKRVPRLVVRLPRATVAATEDADWDHLARALGLELSDPDSMSLEGSLQGVRFVHVVADKDEVRLDADLVLPDLEQRWSQEQERRRLAAEAAVMLAPAPQEPTPAVEQPRSTTRRAPIVRDPPASLIPSDPLAAFDAQQAANRDQRAKMAIRRDTVAARAPTAIRRTAALNWEADAEPRVGMPFDVGAELDSFHESRFAPVDVDPRHRVVQQEVDALVGPPKEPAGVPSTPRATTGSPRRGTSGTAGPNPDKLRNIDDVIAGVELGPSARRAPASASSARMAPSVEAPAPVAPPPAKTEAPGVAELRTKMEINGYELAPTSIEGVAFAAERAKHPMRVLVFAPARLDLPVAVKVLDLVRRMEADIAYVVCADADQDAKERFIATRGRWVAPDMVGQLVLA